MNYFAASSALLALWANGVWAETNSPAQPPIANRPVIVAPSVQPNRSGPPTHPERPPVVGKHPPTPAIKDLVRDFQAARQSFLNQQHDLNRQLKAATDEQRMLIRQQLKENLELWKELQRVQIEELKRQAQDMKNVPNLREVIDSGRGEGRGR